MLSVDAVDSEPWLVDSGQWTVFIGQWPKGKWGVVKRRNESRGMGEGLWQNNVKALHFKTVWRIQNILMRIPPTFHADADPEPNFF